jgi:hypothetical protein
VSSFRHVQCTERRAGSGVRLGPSCFRRPREPRCASPSAWPSRPRIKRGSKNALCRAGDLTPAPGHHRHRTTNYGKAETQATGSGAPNPAADPASPHGSTATVNFPSPRARCSLAALLILRAARTRNQPCLPARARRHPHVISGGAAPGSPAHAPTPRRGIRGSRGDICSNIILSPSG